jgi:glycosyltransferase involved in cell wall biosynthesis
VSYSIVIPVYNEEETVPELVRRVRAVIGTLDAPADVILVDDGSRDGTMELLRNAHREDARFKVVSFSRNFGHQTAISAGIDHARGDAVILMDGDLQDPPEVIPDFVAKWKEGYDVVYAVRTKRKENVLKRAAYAVFYRMLRKLSYLDIPLDSGDFCLMDRKVAETLRRLPERNRFVRGLRTWAGFRQTGLAYERDRRFAGQPKYTLRKLFGLAYDGLFSFSTAPLRWAVYSGFGAAALAFVGGLWVVYEKLVHGIAIAGWTSTIVIITFFGGAILLTLGLVGEYVARIFDEVKQRPTYVVRETMGL